jgi:hypothetical protein
VPAMKLTPNAAMRARDVSRPRAEHLAEAEAAEVRGAGVRGSAGRESPGRAEAGRAETGTVATGSAETGGAIAKVTGDEQAGRPGFPRRRRVPRDAGRRGRSSR